TVIQQPVAAPDLWSGGPALTDLVKLPEIKAELDANNVVFIGVGGAANSQRIITKPPVKSIADLAGLKINSQSLSPELLNAMGITTTMIPSMEIYDAFAKGTIDGLLSMAAGISVYKHYEIGQNWFDIPLGSSIFLQVMNKDTFNKLPDDLKKLIIDMIPEVNHAVYGINQVLGNDRIFEEEIKAKVTVTTPSAEDVALLYKLTEETAWAKWVSDTAERGLPAQDILDTWIELNKKYDAIPRPPYQEIVDQYWPYYELPRQ
ncbi:TRAP transporter substrate-binding protein DctP, partial [Chloroflexota bacterium]